MEFLAVALGLLGLLTWALLPVISAACGVFAVWRSQQLHQRIEQLEQQLSQALDRPERARPPTGAPILAAARPAPDPGLAHPPQPAAASTPPSPLQPIVPPPAEALATPSDPATPGDLATPSDPPSPQPNPSPQPHPAPGTPAAPTPPDPQPRADGSGSSKTPHPAPTAATTPTSSKTPTSSETPDPQEPWWKPLLGLPVERLVVWLAAGLGGLMVLLASLFALSVAINRGWMGPSLRICLGLCSGIGLWVTAEVLRARGYRWLLSGFAGAGMGILYGTLYAAASLYDLLSAPIAFVAMTAVTGVALATALRHQARLMAHLGLLGGLLTPVLLSTGSNRPVALFSYLSLLLLGAVGAGVRRGWPDLVAFAALGGTALYGGWSLSWHQADQLPIALGAGLVLCLPFMLALARRSRHMAPLVELSTLSGLVLLPLAAIPWLLPIDPLFTDPRNGLEVVRPLTGDEWWACAGVILLPLPSWIAARRGQRRWEALIPAATASLLLVIFTLGWTSHPEPMVQTGALAAMGTLVLAVLAQWGRRSAQVSALLLPLTGLMLALSFVGADSGPLLALSLTGLAGVGAAVALAERRAERPTAPILALTLAGVGLALLDAPSLVQDLGASWVATPTILAYTLLSVLPLLMLRPGNGAGAWVAALAGPVLFWPLYQCWQVSAGEPLIGALPVLLGANALLGAGILLRVARVGATSGTLALFVGVALLGITSAVPLQLHDAWLTVAWALEGAALAALSLRLRHRLVWWSAVVLGVLIAVRLLLNPWALSYGDTSGLPIFNWTLYTWGIPALTLLASARWIRPGAAEQPGGRWMPPLLLSLAILVGFALVDVQVSHIFQDEGPVELGGQGLLQGMVRSLAWAGYGVFVLVAGLLRRVRGIRLFGFAFVLLGTAKFFAWDLWSLEGFVRVGSALGLGLSLLLAAFLFEHLVLRSAHETDDDTRTDATDDATPTRSTP